MTPVARSRTGSAALAAVVFAITWSLKRFYSAAGSDQLQWLLAPTAWLVSLASGVAFDLEPHHGYLSRGSMFEIAPACAGVNFLIVAFASLALGLAHACTTARARVTLLAASAAAAYAATVLANASRIALAVRLHEAGASWGALTPARLHCAEGVAVYFLFLLAVFAAATKLAESRRAPAC